MADLDRRDILGAAALTAGGLVAGLALGDAQAAGAKADAMPEVRFDLNAQKARVDAGGLAREATAVNFPISKGLAGVYMKLKAGGLRELHWHANAAEWAYMIGGRARVTIFEPDGRWETLDFGPGDVWFFPRGHGHSIQGLGPDGCTFMLIFDNGYFSEFETFSITDWVAHTPKEVLAKNLGIPASNFAAFPKKEVYIALGPVPPPLPTQLPAASQHSPPLSHRYQLLAQEPVRYPGGTVRLVSSKEFPISANMTGALMTIEPGALRELHWHPNADEWQYYLSGQARMTVFGSSGRARTAEFKAGDVGYVPQGYGHYIECTGDKECQLLLAFNAGRYEEIALSEWLASNPAQLVATNFGIPEKLVDKFPKKRLFFTKPK